MDHGRAVTLEDVAREAGVAVSTVSRALSRPERVSARTREHVQAVARRLDYRPNLLARGLPSGRTRMLALLVTDITNPHQFGLIRGAETQAAAAGYTLVLADSRGLRSWRPSSRPGWGHRWTGTCWRPADGPTTSSSSCAAAARSRCTTGSSRASRAWSATRTTAAARSSGTWSRWATARWPTSVARATRGPRTSGGRRSPRHSRAAGAEIARLGPFPPTLEGGVAAADVGLAAGATALVAFNDLMAIGVLRRLEQRGVAVPGAVSVVGHDDIFGADFCHPPLTTVASPVEEAGRALVGLLLDTRGDDREHGRIVLPTELQVRASTGVAQR